MKPNPLHRLPAPIEAAVQRLKHSARDAAERTIESLGLAALASSQAFQRDGLLAAQFELNRKSAMFLLAFNEAFDERMLRGLAPPPGERGPGGAAARAAVEPAPEPTHWDKLSLVDDKDVEAQISADRFAMDIAQACEWELRELDGYVGSLLGEAGGHEHNPLRPELVGHAMLRGIEVVSERPEVRKALSTELGRSLASLLPATYADIVAGLRNAGVQPLGLSVRHRASRSGDGSGLGSGERHEGAEDHARQTGSGFMPSGDSRYGARPRGPAGPGHGTSLGEVDPALMSLIRRLAFHEGGGGVDTGSAGPGEGFEHASQGQPANLIHVHREELRQASRGSVDHMVIDVIGFMFDQILADPKVPPQMARQIARLQLPVLRAALGDPSFFSARRHPVRRFINRIASLGSAFEDFDDEAGKRFLAKVRALVQQVVEGDFDQIEVYEQKVAELEAFSAELAAGDLQGQGDAAGLLSEKEDQQRLRQLYAQRLAGDLKDVSAPPFLREFITHIWSQVLLRAAEQGGAAGPLAQRLRIAGRELYLSVQPKATPALRKAFLADLPKLMQALSEGMNLIAWPEAQRRAFFGQLMPAHAEALKSPGGRQLEINLMARQVEGALQRPLPSRAELKTAAVLPVLQDEIAAPRFSAEEARRVGLVEESAVDWTRKVDIELAAETAAAADALLPGLPGLPPPPGEPAEPTGGKGLAEHLQIGVSYRMNLDGAWHKVRLAHVSAARGFFIFTYGTKHRQTVSLTQRMLLRLCEAGRLQAYEQAQLVERATARARRQLAALAGSARSA
jgi:hypothetical protein